MDRRTLLGAVGAGTTGIAGLLTDGADGADGASQTTNATATTTTTTGDGFTGIESSADEPFATITVGTREGVANPENNLPHLVRVWNPADGERTVRLTLVRDGRPVLDRRVTFPADGYLNLRLLEPARYELRIRVDGQSATVEVPRTRFDCNESRTDVAVTAAGQVKTETVTTEIGCPPEVVDRTFTEFQGACGSADEASVTFAEEAVRIRGSIQAPNPCHGAKLAGVAVPSPETLRVTVATTEPTADFCAACVGTIPYEVRLAFRERLPETVEVVHQREGSAETVATVARDGAATTTANPETTTAGNATASE